MKADSFTKGHVGLLVFDDETSTSATCGRHFRLRVVVFYFAAAKGVKGREMREESTSPRGLAVV